MLPTRQAASHHLYIRCPLSWEYPSSSHLLVNYCFSSETPLGLFSDTFPDKIDLPQGAHSPDALSTSTVLYKGHRAKCWRWIL